MAKAGKSAKVGKGTGIVHRHLHSRISYLYQAAIYLSRSKAEAGEAPLEKAAVDNHGSAGPGVEEPSSKLDGRLQGHDTSTVVNESKNNETDSALTSTKKPEVIANFSTQTHHLLASMRSISQKSQIRLSQSIKRSVCRRCNGLLMLNSIAEIENLSRGGRKSCADVLVVRCFACGYVRRYPVGMEQGRNRKMKKEPDSAAVTQEMKADEPKHAIGI